MKKNKRLTPGDRRAEILESALNVAECVGYRHLTRVQVANNAGCAESLVSKYFGTMDKFRRTIMRAAVKDEHLPIIAQGLVAGDRFAQKADQTLRSRAMASMA